MASIVDRDALVDNLLDRIDRMEERIRILEATHPGIAGEEADKLAYYRADDGSLHAPGTVELDLDTETLSILDAGSAGATEQDWIEVEVGGNTGYIRVFAAT